MTRLLPSEFSANYGTDTELTLAAFNALESGVAKLLAVSGKLGSGKDSAAPPVMTALGHPDAIHEFFAKPLKDEVDEVIASILNSSEKHLAVRAVCGEQNISLEQANIVVARLWDEVKSGQVASSRTRTDNTRFVLQYWGTDIRRSQDENYWVKIAIRSIIEKLAAGKSVFATDARFENEIDSLTSLGAFTVRLKVSPEVQAARIIGRDGIKPTEEALTHISELALDDYEAKGLFSVVVDTDTLTKDKVVETILEAINSEEAKL